MRARKADAGNWQARGQEFEVGQTVRLTSNGGETEGRVVAAYPGIGMVDVQWPHTSNRHPVEELQIVNPGEDVFVAPIHEDVPGGAGTAAAVSQGGLQDNLVADVDDRVELVHEIGDEDEEDEDDKKKTATVAPTRTMALRVAAAFVKKSLYWHARDRKYRVSREEHGTGSYLCPNRGCDATMRRATYKMENGCKVKLHACPSCLFMIRSSDILDDHHAVVQEGC
jgi:hypothetical protein